ncbi:sterol carrier protein [Euryarchaeota archaeon ex4484_178]|nr:MAG: sterol carrier protein [Euryarchaeota archaeon ex4484_178]
MKEMLQELVKKFNEKDDERKEKIKDLKRSILLRFTDNGVYHMYLENARLSDVEEGEIEADIVLETDTKTFRDIVEGKEDALTAYITKKIRIKAKLMDKLLLSDLLK